MGARLDKLELYKSLREQDNRPKSKQLMYLLGIKGNLMTFLSSYEAKGLITTELKERFKKAKKTHSQTTLWIQFTMDCWLTTVYTQIWKDRCIALKKKDFRTRKRSSPLDVVPPSRIKKLRLILRDPEEISTSHIQSKKIKIRLNPPKKRTKEIRDNHRPKKKHKNNHARQSKTASNTKTNENPPQTTVKPKKIVFRIKFKEKEVLHPDEGDGEEGDREGPLRTGCSFGGPVCVLEVGSYN
jgi:hypothetical protein